MKVLSRIILGLALAAPLAMSSSVRADDKSATNNKDKQDVTMDQLPKPVKATVQREAKGKAPRSMTKSTSNGVVAFEIKLVDGNTETTIDIANDGKVLSKNMRAVGTESAPPPSDSKPGETPPPSQPSQPSPTPPQPPKP